MKSSILRAETDNSGGVTRRTLLGGLAALGTSAVGTVSGRTRTATGGTDLKEAQNGDTFPTPEELERFVDDLVAEHLGDLTPGAAVAIVEGDTTRLAKGYGKANVETNRPVRADETVFRVGSVGKLVTWTAVMQSIEEGVLALDEDVNTYLENSEVEIPDTYDEPVTLGHLGTHTAGFESALDPEVVSDADALAPLETVLAEQQPARIRPPGSAVGYSNYGAALAGHIVAEVHDTTFEDYVESEIFRPLGMNHSTFAQPVPDGHPGTLAAGHTRDGEAFTVLDKVFINMRPAGSLSATPSDMAQFMSVHLGDGAIGETRILDRSTARRMHSVHHVRHPAVNNWRYGFYEYGAPEANLLAHSGSTIYFMSLLVLAPDHDVGIFLNYNSDTAQPARLEQIIDRILDRYQLQPSPVQPDPTDKSGTQRRADALSGEYSLTMLPERGPLHLVDVLAHLSVETTDDGRLITGNREWIESKPYVFHEVDGDDVLAFEMDGDEVDVLNMSSAQQGVHEPVPFHERQLVTGGVVAGSLSGFALSLLGWGGLGAWRRWNQYRTEDGDGGDSGE
jgi:CubicO group peptidase (beta-lactamase class C family)